METLFLKSSFEVVNSYAVNFIVNQISSWAKTKFPVERFYTKNKNIIQEIKFWTRKIYKLVHTCKFLQSPWTTQMFKIHIKQSR